MSLFDASWYLAQNPDVATAGMDPLFHYETYGWREGRDPGPSFDTTDYLERNPDVAAAGVDPLEHYLLYGQYEGRVIDPAGTDLHAVSPPPILVSSPPPPSVAGRFVGTTGDDSIEGNGVIRGLAGNDTLTGGIGHDTVVGGLGNDMLNGSDGNDLLAGGNGDDYLNGGNGDDNMHGGNGDDALNAGNGDDLLYAGAGNDELNGGEGANLLYGGTGADAFNFSAVVYDYDAQPPTPFGQNTIADFEHGVDQIYISYEENGDGGSFYVFGLDAFDTNGNGRTDAGDDGISEQMVALNGVERLSTVLDLTHGEGGFQGDSLTIWGVVGLTVNDFAPSENF